MVHQLPLLLESHPRLQWVATSRSAEGACALQRMGSQHEGGFLIPTEPLCTLCHCPSTAQTSFPRGLMRVADLCDPIALLCFEPRFNFFVNTTSAVNMKHCHTGSLGGLSLLPCERATGVLRQCSTIAPEKLGWSGMWQNPCRKNISVDAIQRSWSLYGCREQYNQADRSQSKRQWQTSALIEHWLGYIVLRLL